MLTNFVLCQAALNSVRATPCRPWSALSISSWPSFVDAYTGSGILRLAAQSVSSLAGLTSLTLFLYGWLTTPDDTSEPTILLTWAGEQCAREASSRWIQDWRGLMSGNR